MCREGNCGGQAQSILDPAANPGRNSRIERIRKLSLILRVGLQFSCILLQLNLLRCQLEAGESFRQPAKLLLSYRPVMPR